MSWGASVRQQSDFIFRLNRLLSRWPTDEAMLKPAVAQLQEAAAHAVTASRAAETAEFAHAAAVAELDALQAWFATQSDQVRCRAFRALWRRRTVW